MARRSRKSKDNKKELSFEKELWQAADKLRGSIDSSEYKHIVLGFIFLKYISDAFESRRAHLKTLMSDKSNAEFYVPDEKIRKELLDQKDQYKMEGIFYVPKKARWSYLEDHASQSNIGELIDAAMEAIENENPRDLKNVLPKIYTKVEFEPQILSELISLFSKINFDHDIDKEKDILGRVYEYFLGQFAPAEGGKSGEFYTPRSLVKVLVEIIEPLENARVFDPACGSGGMFVQSNNFLRLHNKDTSKIAFYGQESNATTWRLCKMNLAIRGIQGQIEHGNSYYDDKFSDLRADFVLANPPFNADWEPNRLSEKDSRLKYGMPPDKNANFMWIQHFVHHLAPNGITGFVMANGALAVGGKEGEIRKKIIEDDLVDIVVACPPKLFYNVGLPVSLWFLTKNKKNDRFKDRTGKTLFIDARELFEPVSKRQVVFNKGHIAKIAGTARAYRGEEGYGKYKDIAGYCKVATKDEIAKNGYVLTPGRYVGVAEEEDDGVPFEEKMDKLEASLKEGFKKGDDLQKQILDNLRKLN